MLLLLYDRCFYAIVGIDHKNTERWIITSGLDKNVKIQFTYLVILQAIYVNW